MLGVLGDGALGKSLVLNEDMGEVFMMAKGKKALRWCTCPASLYSGPAQAVSQMSSRC